MRIYVPGSGVDENKKGSNVELDFEQNKRYDDRMDGDDGIEHSGEYNKM